MALFNFRDSWNVWRRKVDESLGTVEPIPASNVILDGSDVSVNSAIQQLTSADENLENQVTGLSDNVFANGSVNLFPISVTTQTVSGITFTVNSDGTITANGTSTAEISFSLYGSQGNRLFDTGVLQKGKSYKISGTPSGITDAYMYLRTSDGATKDSGEGAIVHTSLSTTGGNFTIAMPENVTLDNVIFKPMITVADMPNSDYEHYVPYAMSNKELTEIVDGTVLQNGLAITITYTPSTDESWQSRLYHLYQELQTFQNTLKDDEKFTITNLTLGTTSLWNLIGNAYFRNTSIIGADFISILPHATQMSFRAVRFEPTEANIRFSKTLINYSDNSVLCTDESTTVGTNSVSLRIVKYKYNE